MRKFSPSQLGIISESDNIFRIRVVVFDLNSKYLDNSEFFPGLNSQYSDNSEFCFWVIRSIQTILNFFPGSIRNSKFISESYAEKIWKFIKILFFSRKYFFLIRKSLNTPNSIFRAIIRNFLLRVKTLPKKNNNKLICFMKM